MSAKAWKKGRWRWALRRSRWDLRSSCKAERRAGREPRPSVASAREATGTYCHRSAESIDEEFGDSSGTRRGIRREAERVLLDALHELNPLALRPDASRASGSTSSASRAGACTYRLSALGGLVTQRRAQVRPCFLIRYPHIHAVERSREEDPVRLSNSLQ